MNSLSSKIAFGIGGVSPLATEAQAHDRALACGNLINLSSALKDIDRLSDRFQPGQLYHAVIGWVHEACLVIAKAESAGLDKAEVLHHLTAARAIHARSDWLRRLQEWPRGYPGDFETIEVLCRGDREHDLSTVHGCLEYFALNCVAAQQHRNKIAIQTQIVTRAIHSGTNVFSIACGGCIDIGNALNLLGPGKTVFYLNDVDEDALETARRLIEGAGGEYRIIPGNIARAVGSAKIGEIGAILIGGLFDYMPDKLVRHVLARCYETILLPGGTLTFTNIDYGNPYRHWICRLANWELIERSRADIERLIGEAGIPSTEVLYEKEATGLTHTVQIQKGDGRKT